MIDWLLQPLSYEFMQRGLVAAVIVGLVCSIIGCYVVLRSMAFLGDALAHAILPGIAISYLVGGNLMIGALIAAVIVALSIGFFSRHGTIREDTAIGVLFSAALASGYCHYQYNSVPMLLILAIFCLVMFLALVVLI